MIIKVKRLSESAILPSQNTDGDAGYDLYATEDYTLKPLERHLFNSDIAVVIPYGYYGRIADRSGNAYKKGLHVLAGVIDSTYRGSIGVVLLNTNSPKDDGDYWGNVEIKKGHKVAQIIFEKCEKVDFLDVQNLDPTERGDKGFGSSDSK